MEGTSETFCARAAPGSSPRRSVCPRTGAAGSRAAPRGGRAAGGGERRLLHPAGAGQGPGASRTESGECRTRCWTRSPGCCAWTRWSRPICTPWPGRAKHGRRRPRRPHQHVRTGIRLLLDIMDRAPAFVLGPPHGRAGLERPRRRGARLQPMARRRGATSPARSSWNRARATVPGVGGGRRRDRRPSAAGRRARTRRPPTARRWSANSRPERGLPPAVGRPPGQGVHVRRQAGPPPGRGFR